MCVISELFDAGTQHEHSPECQENWIWRAYEAELLARFNILNELQYDKNDS